MISVNCLDISDIDKNTYQKFYFVASEERKRKADRYHSFEHSKRCILTEGLLRFSLFQKYGFEQDMIIEYNKYGKPFLKNINGFFYNISHSDKWVVIAYADNEVGIDVEKIKIDNNWEKIVNRFFAREEKEYIFSAADNRERAYRFTKIWTLKEAYGKYLGSGLAKTLNSFVFDGVSETVRDFSGKIDTYIKIKSYLLDNCYLSVCGIEDNVAIQTITINQLI